MNMDVSDDHSAYFCVFLCFYWVCITIHPSIFFKRDLGSAEKLVAKICNPSWFCNFV